MSLAQRFSELPFFNLLGKRQQGFLAIMRHLDSLLDNREQPYLIVETGCARRQANWIGDGMSTVIWDWVRLVVDRPAIEVRSVDKDPDAVRLARQLAPQVRIDCQDSVDYLEAFRLSDTNRIKLLYLDSFDWSPETQERSSDHHLRELVAVWDHLPSNCLIVVDDRHTPEHGKHLQVQKFMEERSIKPAFVGYQIGWIKP